MSSFILKQKAKQVMRQTVGLYWLFLLPVLLSLLVVWSTYQAELNPSYDLVTSLSGYIFNTTLSLLFLFFITAVSFTMLEVFRGQRQDLTWQDALRSFSKEEFSKVAATSFWLWLFQTLWGLPVLIGQLLMSQAEVYLVSSYLTDFALIEYYLGFALVLLGTVLQANRLLAYSQAFFILHDQIVTQTYQNGRVAITASRQLMKGHKLELLTISISFIGWIFLAVLTMGLAFTYLLPYFVTTQVIYYEQLRYAQIIKAQAARARAEQSEIAQTAAPHTKSQQSPDTDQPESEQE